jgi:endonuclease YncB( thermonuclease family)
MKNILRYRLNVALRVLLMITLSVASFLVGRATVAFRTEIDARERARLRAIAASQRAVIRQQYEQLERRDAEQLSAAGELERLRAKQTQTIEHWLQKEVADTPHVVSVRGGDELAVQIGGEQRHVELAGIDCPDRYELFGDEARQFTAALCLDQDVELIDRGQDGYGRMRADVLVAGVDVSRELVKAGWARHDNSLGDDPELAELEQEARRTKLGIWADE